MNSSQAKRFLAKRGARFRRAFGFPTEFMSGSRRAGGSSRAERGTRSFPKSSTRKQTRATRPPRWPRGSRKRRTGSQTRRSMQRMSRANYNVLCTEVMARVLKASPEQHVTKGSLVAAKVVRNAKTGQLVHGQGRRSPRGQRFQDQEGCEPSEADRQTGSCRAVQKAQGRIGLAGCSSRYTHALLASERGKAAH